MAQGERKLGEENYKESCVDEGRRHTKARLFARCESPILAFY